MTIWSEALQIGWILEYQRKKALWTHGGNPLQPHALLTSGNHSDSFCNSRPVIFDEPLLRQAASDLVDLLIGRGLDIEKPDRVVGPQTGATRLAEFVSDEIGLRRPRLCKWASPAKVGEGSSRKMVFNNPARKVLPGEMVLIVEDALTTGGSVELTGDAVVQAGGLVLAFVGALVNQSGLTELGDKEIVALINREMSIWTPEKCLLCKAGSEAIPAKDPENWARLNAKYD